ncbi:MAG: ATP-binding protein [Candidatus Helarchaeota archaeon]
MSKTELIGNLFGMTTPIEVKIILDPNVTRTKPVEIGEYITIGYPKEVLKEEVLALITDVGLLNESIPDSLMKSPESYKKLERLGDFSGGEKLLASARIIGYYDEKEKTLKSPRFPSVPGAKVYRSNIDILRKVFSAGQVRIGHLRAHPDVEVTVDVNELVRRHTCILAITGAGKGNTVAVLSTRILKLNGSIIIIDPHEEYPSLREFEDFNDKVVVFSPSGDTSKGYFPLKFKWSNFSTEELFEIFEIKENATKQQALIREVLDVLEDQEWDLDQFKFELGRVELPEEDDEEEGKKKKKKDRFKGVRPVVLDHIKGLKAQEIFDKRMETPIVDETGPCFVKPGQITVISVSNLPQRVQQVVVARLAKKIYEAGVAWRRKISDKTQLPCPTYMIIEEAHNFIPARGSSRSLAPIARIAAEGRKFGVGLCVVSQRPGKIEPNILSQCNSQIILKIVNPEDQSQIRRSAEAMSDDLLADLPSLNKGEAVIIGSCLLLPALVKIDKFTGELGGDDINIIGEWKSTALKNDKSEDPGPDYTKNKKIERRTW